MTSPRLEPPPSTLPPGSTVWAYLRDSGGPTQDSSVEQQRAVIEEYCARHGLVLIHPPFEDVHKSGTSTKNRTEFEYMMSLSASERLRPKGLLIWNHARFSRGGPYDVQFFKSTLRQRGIVIHSLTDKIPEGKFAPVIESLIETANQAKAEEAAMGAWRGLRHLVKQGAVPGTPPRGIRRTPITVRSESGSEHIAHRWEPDPHFAHRVLTAFEMKAAGKSLAQIHRATRLYGSLNGYTTFFQNCIYIGTLKFGDLIVEKYCKPSIPRKLWNKVQAILSAHAERAHLRSAQNHPRRVNATYLLSGVMQCARCGAAMNGLTSRQPSGKDYLRYRCNNAKQKLTCTAKPIPAALDKAAEAVRVSLIKDGSCLCGDACPALPCKCASDATAYAIAAFLRALPATDPTFLARRHALADAVLAAAKDQTND
jgi:DNA invertase Pin-like site-specific DNA recombinase